MRYLITGGCGFLGSNLVAEALALGEEVFVIENFSRTGSEANLSWLQTCGDFKLFRWDIRNAQEVVKCVQEARPDVVFHVAGQVAMTTSLQDPRADLETNVLGTFNVLDALRQHALEATVLYSSTNKVYGDLEQLDYRETTTRYESSEFPEGMPETLPLDFRTPYGCSKGAADQYMKDFFLSYDLRTVVFRHSSIYGSRQFSTYDQGWVGWFVRQALEIKIGRAEKLFTISGNGKQVRDVLHSKDLVCCYFNASANIDATAGRCYNIGGGMAQSLSLLELFAFLEQTLDIRMKFDALPPRASDQKVFVADVRKANKEFGWQPTVSKEEGLRMMIDWVDSYRGAVA